MACVSTVTATFSGKQIQHIQFCCSGSHCAAATALPCCVQISYNAKKGARAPGAGAARRSRVPHCRGPSQPDRAAGDPLRRCLCTGPKVRTQENGAGQRNRFLMRVRERLGSQLFGPPPLSRRRYHNTDRSMLAMVGLPANIIASSNSWRRISTTRATPSAPAMPRPHR